MNNNDDAGDASRVSRRAFLKAGGAGSVGGLLLAGSTVYAAQRWDLEADVVVVGSGAAGSVAALFAHSAGASVLMLEKAPVYGGTTAKSGGVFWIPNNYLMREKGIEDARADLLRYLARVSYPTLYNPADSSRFGLPEDLHRLHTTFYEEASPTIDTLRAMGLKTQPWLRWDGLPMPDYYAQLSEDKAPHWRALMSSPLDDRINGAALIGQLKMLIEQRKIPVFMEHRAVSLVTNSTGAVVGVKATNDMGNVISIRARRGVVFGTGGFTQNAQMCLNYLRGPIFGGCTVPTGEGDLIPMASAVRAKLANMNNAWWRPIILEQALQFRSVPSGIGSTPGDSMIVVNGDGRRCVDEKIQYNERGQAHFAWDPTRGRYPNLILFMIYDQSCRDRFGGSSPLIFKSGVNAPYVLSAPTLAELARVIDERLAQIADRTGNFRLDPGFTANLNETIQRFNLFAESGKDLDFHRGEVPYDLSQHGEARGNTYPNVTMKPIGAGPYYAVMVGGGTLDTKGGPKINPHAQMLDVDENPIAGLYGAGNCVASPSGQAYWAGGSTIGLAMVFGGLAGKAAAAAPETKMGLHA